MDLWKIIYSSLEHDYESAIYDSKIICTENNKTS